MTSPTPDRSSSRESIVGTHINTQHQSQTKRAKAHQQQQQQQLLSTPTSTLAFPFTMRFLLVAVFVLTHQCAGVDAFVPTTLLRSNNNALRAESKTKGGSSAELGLPCEDECAIVSFPNLPPSVHPGVLSGQAQIDLLNHAKENGEYETNKQTT